MARLEPYRGDYYLWKYLPSVPAAVIFFLLFLGATGAVCWRIYHSRAWFCIVLSTGGLLQVLGYLVRIVAHYNTGKLMPYAVQNSFILLAPVFFAASIYMTLSRIIRAAQGDHLSLIRPSRLSKIFVAGDITALAIQGSSAGLMIVAELADIGKGVVIAGLVFHVCIFAIFCTVTAVFHLRLLRELRSKSPTYGTSRHSERLMQMLYICSGLIMFRSIFRIIEFAMGNDGYLLSNEWPLYVFDSVPMFIVMLVFWKWFPSALPQSKGAWTNVVGEVPLDIGCSPGAGEGGR